MSEGNLKDLIVLKQKFFDALNNDDKKNAIRILQAMDEKCLNLNNVSLNTILTDDQKSTIQKVLGQKIFEDKDNEKE